MQHWLARLGLEKYAPVFAEHDGLQQRGYRIVVPETPVRVEYALTTKGRALTNAIDAIGAWAQDWIPENASRASKAQVRKPQASPRGVRRARRA